MQKKLVEIERCKDISLKIEQQELNFNAGRTVSLFYIFSTIEIQNESWMLITKKVSFTGKYYNVIYYKKYKLVFVTHNPK